MERSFNSQKGAVLITFAVLLTVLVGFSALAMEVGRWYLIKAELSKAVDAAALAGAENISNPFLSGDKLHLFAKEVGKENFPTGYAGTPGEGKDGTIVFTTTYDSLERKFSVTGNVSMFPILTGVFGIQMVAINGFGVAQKNDVEIMMVLDRSGSMAGTPITNLKTAALSFLSFFTETEENDKMGLVTFSNGVTVNHALSTNFVSDMTVKINAMTATWATNAEDAIDQTDGPSGFTDQTLLPGDQRVPQYMIFFTDGRPTAFKGRFRRNAIDYDAVVMGTGNYCDTVYGYMGHTDSENFYTPTGQPTGTSLLPPTPTGDGNMVSGSPLTNCTYAYYPYSRYLNTRWYIFGDAKYGLPGYSPVQCTIPESVLAPYICNTAKKMAIDHAQELKDKGIMIYIIGLEGNGGVDHVFLGQVASGPTFEYYAPTSDKLEALFNAIAKEIKLRLVR